MPVGGKRPGAGRPKGVPNKLTSDIRAAILAAFNGVGGIAYLQQQARENPQAFMTLLGKIVPAEVKATITDERAVIRAPVVAADSTEWAKQNTPTLQ